MKFTGGMPAVFLAGPYTLCPETFCQETMGLVLMTPSSISHPGLWRRTISIFPGQVLQLSVCDRNFDSERNNSA